MSALEQEIMAKFRLLDKTARQRIREFIEREAEEPADNEEMSSTEKRLSWVDFINATYGSLADDPLDEIDNSQLPPPIRDEVE